MRKTWEGLLPVLSERISSIYIEATSDKTETTLLKCLQKQLPDLSEGLGLASALIGPQGSDLAARQEAARCYRSV